MADQETNASAPIAGDKGVQLGIGTLIIIALIVTMCSGKGEVEKIRQDTAALKQQVGEINRKLDTLIKKQEGLPAGDVEAASTPPAAGTTPARHP